MAAKGLGNPLTDRSLLAAVAPQLEVDSSFSLGDMLSLVLTYHSVDPNTAPTLTLPVSVDESLSYIYQGYDYGNVVLPVQPLDQQVIDQVLGISANTNSLTGEPLPPQATVSVSVLNGTGEYNQAVYTAHALAALGFHIAGVGDTPSVSSQSETVVYYASKSPADQAAAQAVAHTLSGAVITALGPTSGGAQVTVVTGTQFSVNPPPAPPVAGGPTTPAPDGVTTTTSSPSSTTTGTGGSSFLPPPPPSRPSSPGTPDPARPRVGSGGQSTRSPLVQCSGPSPWAGRPRCRASSSPGSATAPDGRRFGTAALGTPPAKAGDSLGTAPAHTVAALGHRCLPGDQGPGSGRRGRRVR